MDYSKIVEKRKATIAKKRLEKEANKAKLQEKMVKKHEENLINIKDDKNKSGYAKILNKFNKFKNKKIIKTGARYKGQDVIEIIVHETMKKDEILKYVNSLSKDLGKINKTGLLDIAVRGNQWLYGGQTTWGEEVVYSDDYDQINGDEYDSFAIYFSALPSGFMGHSKNNDCVYECLYECLGEKLKKIWSEPIKLKNFLKIPYTQKIDIRDLEKIEKKINCSINCTGDYCYTSKINNIKVINLLIINEHCKIDEYNKEKDDIRKTLSNRISRRDRYILMYNKRMDPVTGEYFMCFDGITKFQLSKEYRDDIYNWKTNYILVHVFDTKLSLEENYFKFLEMANNLKAKSNGKINLYQTGDFINTSLYLFNNFTKHIPTPPPILQREAELINLASQGAIIFTSKGFKGKVYKADINSMYPSIMNSQMLFPVKDGELKYIKEFKSEFFEYGIYRAIVHMSDNVNINKLFRFNYSKNVYTNVDLTRAKELELDIELIVDDQPNFLYYSRDKLLTGTEIFGEYVNLLFPLKQEKVHGSKDILNRLWGTLCQRNMKKQIHDHTSSFEIPDDVRPIFKPYNDDTTIIKYAKYEKQNIYTWARIKPFLLAKGRSIISKIMEPYKNILIRCHTDGVYFSEEPKDIKYGSQLGELRYEGLHDILINQSGLVYELHHGKYKLMNTIGTDDEVLLKDK
jgi:hypothetical protein